MSDPGSKQAVPSVPLEVWVILATGCMLLPGYVLIPGDERWQSVISNLGLTATSGLATILCLRASAHLRRGTPFWRLLGLACLSWFAGQLIWDYHALLSGRAAPFPTLADLGYILFYPICALALFHLIRHASLPLGIGAVIDGLIVSAVATLFCYEFLVVPLSRLEGSGAVGSWATVVSQVGIVGLLALGLLALIWSRDAANRGPLAVVLAGLLSFAITDVIDTRAGFAGADEVGIGLDLGWNVGFLLLGLAAVLAVKGEGGVLQNHQFRGVRWRRAGMQLSVLAFGGLAAYAASQPGSSPVVTIGVIVVAVLLAIKLTYAAETEQRLTRRTLERDRLAAEVSAREATQAEVTATLEAQRAANAALARVNQAKSDFVSVVSHEFRTPLTSVQGFADLLKEEALDEAHIKEFAEIIGANARRLTRMVNDMLDLDRLQSSQVPSHRAPTSLNAVVAHVVATLGPTATLHQIRLNLDASLPVFVGDRDQVTQVVTNLLANAIKYQPNGGAIEIRTWRERTVLRLCVRDHGIGIPPEYLETIFERFARTPEASQSIQGTGLGLPITRQLVELHGGRIWAEPAAGDGTTFHVDLPLSLTPRFEQGADES